MTESNPDFVTGFRDHTPIHTTNMLNAFDALPDSADCWLYATDRPLTDDERQMLEDLFESFQKDWSSHGRTVQGACQVLGNRLVIVAAHVTQGDISGCGIDKSLHLLQQVAESRQFNWASALNIILKDSDGLYQVVSRSEFKEGAMEGRFGADTPVVDLSIRSLGQLREGGLERAAGQSWHQRLLPKVDATPS